MDKAIPRKDNGRKSDMGESIKESLFMEAVASNGILKMISLWKETAVSYDDIGTMFLNMPEKCICNPLSFCIFSDGIFLNWLGHY